MRVFSDTRWRTCTRPPCASSKIRARVSCCPRRAGSTVKAARAGVTSHWNPAVGRSSPGRGCPNTTDPVRGRRPGSGRDYVELMRLTHHFDAVQMLTPLVEAQLTLND